MKLLFFFGIQAIFAFLLWQFYGSINGMVPSFDRGSHIITRQFDYPLHAEGVTIVRSRAGKENQKGDHNYPDKASAEILFGEIGGRMFFQNLQAEKNNVEIVANSAELQDDVMHLSGGVRAVSFQKDWVIETESAILDNKNNSIAGNKKATYNSSDARLEAKSFIFDMKLGKVTFYAPLFVVPDYR